MMNAVSCFAAILWSAFLVQQCFCLSSYLSLSVHRVPSAYSKTCKGTR